MYHALRSAWHTVSPSERVAALVWLLLLLPLLLLLCTSVLLTAQMVWRKNIGLGSAIDLYVSLGWLSSFSRPYFPIFIKQD